MREAARGTAPGLDPIDEASGLRRSQAESLARRLVALRDEMRSRFEAHVRPARSGEGSCSDEMDQATLAQENSLSLQLAEKDERLLGEVEAALRRVADGTYGVCEGTGDEIGFRRLDACPWSRNSVEFEEQREREARLRRGSRG